MRAGCFAEDRVIELMNRRFVSYYFNRSGVGEGGSDAATKFVNGQTDNPYAYFAAFKPTGELVGETTLYSDKDAVMTWLEGLLRSYPEYGKATDPEAAVMAAGGLAAAELAEDLADYTDAKARYGELLKSEAVDDRTGALLGLLRIYRYEANWRQHEVTEDLLRAAVGGDAESMLLHDAVVERGCRLLANKQFAEARSLLQAESRRTQAESHSIDAQAALRMAEVRLRFVTTMHQNGNDR